MPRSRRGHWRRPRWRNAPAAAESRSRGTPLRRSTRDPKLTPMAEQPKPTQKALREQRLQAALRENLKRRKSQMRARADNRDQSVKTHDSAGIATDKDA